MNFRPRLWRIVLPGALFFMALSADLRAGEFVPGIEDLPLAPGLAAHAENSVLFDTPSGRIVDAIAAGRVSRTAILAFYARTLPQLGWREISRGAFVRGDELLRLEISVATANLTEVRFSLNPRPGTAR